jgi:DNA-binding NarL/FixJ family response regulator
MKPCGPILVVDDDASFREFACRLLVEHGFEAREASSGAEALVAAEADRPALVLLDVNLGGMSGYEVCRTLKDAHGEQLPIIFVSGERTGTTDRAAGLLIGGDDYIVKPFDANELLARVRRCVDRANLFGSHRPASASDLTPRELEILALLAEGVRADAIAAALVLSPKTVATHIQRILAKLGLHSRAEAIAFAHTEGLARAALFRGHGEFGSEDRHRTPEELHHNALY